MEKNFIAQITFLRNGFDNYTIRDIESLLSFNIKVNDPYYKTRLLNKGDKITLDGTSYTVNEISFLLHPLDHIELSMDSINCDVVVELI